MSSSPAGGAPAGSASKTLMPKPASTPTPKYSDTAMAASTVSTSAGVQDRPQITPNHPCAILKLPRELMDEITRQLPTVDFNNLRLTCRRIENIIFPYWANSFFKRKQFMIEPFSLKTLFQISRHDALSKVMTDLVIGLDNVAGMITDHLRTIDEVFRRRRAVNAQRDLLETGQAVALLSSALAKLPNLKAVHIRDYNSATRYRDVRPEQPISLWRSYGISAYYPSDAFPEYDIRVCQPRQMNSDIVGRDFTRQVARAVFKAVGRASVHLQVLEVVLKNKRFALNDDVFDLSCGLGPGLASVFGGLTKLHLDIDFWAPSETVAALQRQIDKSDGLKTYTVFLRRLLSFTPRLKWLRLNCACSGPAQHDFFNWLAGLALDAVANPAPNAYRRRGTVDLGEANTDPVTFPLKSLDLGNAVLEPELLLRLVDKFPALESLSLKGIVLFNEYPGALKIMAQQLHAKENQWARVFRRLSRKGPKLKRLNLCNLKIGGGLRATKIVFVQNMDEEYPLGSIMLTDMDKAAWESLAAITWTYNNFQKHKDRLAEQSSQSTDESGDVNAVDLETDAATDSEEVSNDNGADSETDAATDNEEESNDNGADSETDAATDNEEEGDDDSS